MRHAGLVAFGITTAVLVPAALHHLDAGSAQIGKLVAPGARSIQLGGATIDVALDRAIADAGDTVHLTLTARAAGEQKVTVAVLLLESMGSSGGRVDAPPRQVARETVTFAAGEIGARRQLAFKLRGHRGLGMEGIAPFGSYTVLVMPPKAADQLERMRKRAAAEENPMEDERGRYGAWSRVFYALGQLPDEGEEADDEYDLDGDDPHAADIAAVLGKRGQAARLEVLTRPKDSPVAIRAPETATLDQPFKVTVTVKNPGKQRIRHLGVRLQQPPLYGNVEYAGISGEGDLTIAPESATIDLGPRESTDIEFTVTAWATGTAGLYAATHCDDAEDDWDVCHSVLDGQLDATDIVEAPEPAAVTTVAAAPAAPAAAAAP